MILDRAKDGEGRSPICLLKVCADGVYQWVTCPERRSSRSNGSGTSEREVPSHPWAHRLFEIERDMWPGRIPWDEANDARRGVDGLDIDAVEPTFQGRLE